MAKSTKGNGKKKTIIQSIILILLVVGIGFSFIPLFKNLKFGLDLQGGFEILYKAESIDGSKMNSEKLTATYKTLSKRIDSLGVSEPEIVIEGNDKIEKITNAKPVEVLSEKGKVTGLVIEDAKTHTQRTLDVKGIFPYEGENPMSSALVSLDVVNTRGYVVVDENRMTKVPGIYAAGDIVDKDLRQVVTATNDGAIAAQHINRMIKMKKYQ